jgi:putative ABC transport system ATP-binding protein
MSLVEIRGVTKTYRRGSERIEVLHGVDLDIPQGEFLALMGPSGSGKTTLLNLIGGLDTPTGGQIVIGGQRIDQLSSRELARWRAAHVGFVFQFYNLMPVLSAQRNVELPLLLTSLSAAERRRRATIALTLVGLADRARHKPRELSGGQEQRVAIARAIVSDPTLLICDEPTGDLDRGTAAEILTLLQMLNREHGKTVVMVTHDPKAAEYASRRLMLDKGTLAKNGVSRLPYLPGDFRELYGSQGLTRKLPLLWLALPQEDAHRPTLLSVFVARVPCSGTGSGHHRLDRAPQRRRQAPPDTARYPSSSFCPSRIADEGAGVAAGPRREWFGAQPGEQRLPASRSQRISTCTEFTIPPSSAKPRPDARTGACRIRLVKRYGWAGQKPRSARRSTRRATAAKPRVPRPLCSTPRTRRCSPARTRRPDQRRPRRDPRLAGGGSAGTPCVADSPSPRDLDGDRLALPKLADEDKTPRG